MKKEILAGAILVLLLGGVILYNVSRSGAPDTQEAPASGLLSGKPQTVPVPGQVTMVDIGAHSCIPCKMMAPILVEVSGEYQGRAAIVFIDVKQYPDQAQQYGIRAIPTQIFYDADGAERFRHEGFLDKDQIAAILTELGVPGAQ